MKIKLCSSKQGIYFTSDTHYNHSNIIKSLSNWGDLETAREGFNSVQEMNDKIVDNINNLVAPDDVLFHMGDVAFGKDAVIEFRKRINCKNIYLVLGNHDKEIDKQQSLKSLLHGAGTLMKSVKMGSMSAPQMKGIGFACRLSLQIISKICLFLMSACCVLNPMTLAISSFSFREKYRGQPL